MLKWACFVCWLCFPNGDGDFSFPNVSFTTKIIGIYKGQFYVVEGNKKI